MKRQDELNEAWCKYRGKCTTDDLQALAFAMRWCDSHPNWISGEDKPRENGFYLCYSDKEKAYEILSLYGADWYDAYEHYIPSCDVTHWMPLPQPPTKKGGEE